ncbi:hypothetical protein [Actinospica robiniae]|uniref:hypothetical protein n=1 Tax=Actinospica robiniae TaxID=304901 RepID=UPI0003FEC765|nr:hypothetical protein [Actinospica robiniae]
MTTVPAEIPEPDRGAAAAAGDLVAELRSIRRRTRRLRRAYGFPLLVFGVLIAAAAPLYVQHEPHPGLSAGVSGPDPAWVQSFGGMVDGYRDSAPVTLAVFWLAAIAVGAAAMVLWYRRHARQTGVRSRVAPSILTWAAVSALVIGLPLFGRNWFISELGWNASYRGTLALLVIGLGLCVLAATERSLFLAVTALAFCATAVYSMLGDPENTVFRVLSWCGVRDDQMPYTLAPMAAVLFPAAVLLIGAAVAAGPPHLPKRKSAAR